MEKRGDNPSEKVNNNDFTKHNGRTWDLSTKVVNKKKHKTMVSPLKPKHFDGRSQHPNLVEIAKKFGQSVFNGLMGFRDSICL